MTIICTFLLLFSGLLGGNGHYIIIEVDNIRKAEGKFMVAVFDCPEKYMSDQVCSSLVMPVTSDDSQKLNVPVSATGTYAICLFQDLNKNGKLDRNRLGIPDEPYGFSNNPTIIWGPPGFDKTSFMYTGEAGKKLTIRLK
jgi:uncharacterized protein (DUF2141 family)